MSTMAAALKRLQSVDDRTKDTVFGYIKAQQIALSLSIIPPLVCHLCLSYYYQNEHFTTTSKDMITITNNEIKITKVGIEGWNNTTYGNIWIDSNIPQIAKWTVRISAKQTYPAYICIVSHEGREEEDCTDFYEDAPLYAMPSKNGYVVIAIHDQKEIGLPSTMVDSNIWSLAEYKPITVILNTKTKTISYQEITTLMDGNDTSTNTEIIANVSCGESIRYKLAVTIVSTGDSVELLDFESFIIE